MSQIIDTRHGKMSIAHENDYISQHLINSGEYEWYIVEILTELAKGCDTGSILDIGANIGTVSLPLARQFPQYTVHAFEVQPMLVNNIRENIALNNLENITIHAYGLGSADRTVSLNQPDYDHATNIGAFSLNPLVWKHSDWAQGKGSKINFAIKPLDSVTIDQPIRCIKIDVEGYEQMVLEGALETLKRHNYPPIVYELWSYNEWWRPAAEELEKFLSMLGYQIEKINDTGIARHKTSV